MHRLCMPAWPHCALSKGRCAPLCLHCSPNPIAIFHRIGSAPSPGHFGWVFSIAGGCPSPWLPVGWFLSVAGTFKGSNLRRGDGACLRIKRSSRATDSHLKCTRTPRGPRPPRARRWPSRARPSHTDSTPLLGLGRGANLLRIFRIASRSTPSSTLRRLATCSGASPSKSPLFQSPWRCFMRWG